MSLKEPSENREVSGITDQEKSNIVNFLQGAVYCWCKNRKDEWFSMRDLKGGDNFYWEGTPLQCLYNKHEPIANDPFAAAGKDGGWLLKKVINKDKRSFESKKEDLIRKYRWIN